MQAQCARQPGRHTCRCACRALLVLAPLTCESPKELPVETERSPIRPEKLGTVSHAHTLPQSPPCINGAGTLRLHGVNRRHVQAPALCFVCALCAFQCI